MLTEQKTNKKQSVDPILLLLLDSVDQFECFLWLNNFSDNSRMGFRSHSLPPDGAFMPKPIPRFWAYLGTPTYAQPLTFPKVLFCHLKVHNIR